MSQDSVELQDTSKFTEQPGGPGRGPGALLRWFFILFFIFAVLGIYAVSQRMSEGRYVVERERGAGPGGPAIVIYEVRGGQIARTWVLR